MADGGSASPGHAAYEALHASIKCRKPHHGSLAWDDMGRAPGLDDVLHEDWEAAASAVASHLARQFQAARADELTKVRAERDDTRALLAEVRSVLLEGGQDATTARRRALAIIGTGDGGPATRHEDGRGGSWLTC